MKTVDSEGSTLGLCQALLHEHYTAGLGLKAPHGFRGLANDTLRILESAGSITCRRQLCSLVMVPCSLLQDSMQKARGPKLESGMHSIISSAIHAFEESHFFERLLLNCKDCDLHVCYAST